jgi:hypothetical protein
MGEHERKAAAGIHEVLRYRREQEVRVYSLHVVPGGTELWRVTETAGQAPVSVKETDFRRSDAAAEFLEEVRRALTAGGWRPTGG